MTSRTCNQKNRRLLNKPAHEYIAPHPCLCENVLVVVLVTCVCNCIPTHLLNQGREEQLAQSAVLPRLAPARCASHHAQSHVAHAIGTDRDESAGDTDRRCYDPCFYHARTTGAESASGPVSRAACRPHKSRPARSLTRSTPEPADFALQGHENSAMAK